MLLSAAKSRHSVGLKCRPVYGIPPTTHPVSRSAKAESINRSVGRPFTMRAGSQSPLFQCACGNGSLRASTRNARLCRSVSAGSAPLPHTLPRSLNHRHLPSRPCRCRRSGFFRRFYAGQPSLFPLGSFALVHLKQTPFRQSSASELGIDETAGIPESPWRTDCVASVVYGRPVRWSAGQTHVSDTEPSLTDPERSLTIGWHQWPFRGV